MEQTKISSSQKVENWIFSSTIIPSRWEQVNCNQIFGLQRIPIRPSLLLQNWLRGLTQQIFVFQFTQTHYWPNEFLKFFFRSLDWLFKITWEIHQPAGAGSEKKQREFIQFSARNRFKTISSKATSSSSHPFHDVPLWDFLPTVSEPRSKHNCHELSSRHQLSSSHRD